MIITYYNNLNQLSYLITKTKQVEIKNLRLYNELKMLLCQHKELLAIIARVKRIKSVSM